MRLMETIEIRRLKKTYQVEGHDFTALDVIDASFIVGSFSVIIGKSGCGKTTLLRLLAGMEKVTAGSIAFPPIIKRVGMVFQEPRLMPWLTVRGNMGFAIEETEEPPIVEERVNHYIRMLGLDKFQHAYPGQLSGGMAQRVSLGRTLCYEPDLILMDEPFGALDYFTRQQLQREMTELFLAQQKTVVFVTHDVGEAVLLGQSIMIMDSGRITQTLPVTLPYHRQPLSKEFVVLQQRVLEKFGTSVS